jgi:hypothetical protein
MFPVAHQYYPRDTDNLQNETGDLHDTEAGEQRGRVELEARQLANSSNESTSKVTITNGGSAVGAGAGTIGHTGPFIAAGEGASIESVTEDTRVEDDENPWNLLFSTEPDPAYYYGGRNSQTYNDALIIYLRETKGYSWDKVGRKHPSVSPHTGQRRTAEEAERYYKSAYARIFKEIDPDHKGTDDGPLKKAINGRRTSSQPQVQNNVQRSVDVSNDPAPKRIKNNSGTAVPTGSAISNSNGVAKLYVEEPDPANFFYVQDKSVGDANGCTLEQAMLLHWGDTQKLSHKNMHKAFNETFFNETFDKEVEAASVWARYYYISNKLGTREPRKTRKTKNKNLAPVSEALAPEDRLKAYSIYWKAHFNGASFDELKKKAGWKIQTSTVKKYFCQAQSAVEKAKDSATEQPATFAIVLPIRKNETARRGSI